MAESKLVKLNFENNSYSVCSIVFMYSVYVHSLLGMILLYLAVSFLH